MGQSLDHQRPSDKAMAATWTPNGLWRLTRGDFLVSLGNQLAMRAEEQDEPYNNVNEAEI
jgi:hypothetical protein